MAFVHMTCLADAEGTSLLVIMLGPVCYCQCNHHVTTGHLAFRSFGRACWLTHAQLLLLLTH